jgi:diguanylate cyclase (GGDEF)-like protein
VISIKKYLGTEETDDTPIRIFQLLLEAIGLHLVEGHADDQTRLRCTLQQASLAVSRAATPAEYLMETRAIIQALADYTFRTNQIIHRNRTELQTMVGMLTKAVQSIAAGAGDSVVRLQEMEGQLAASTQIEDVRLLRLRLADCLTAIREETTMQRNQQAQALETLRANNERPGAAGASPSIGKTDTVTGLGDRGAAEAEINDAIRAQRKAFAAVMVLDRLRSYNAAFGYEVGDKVLRHFAEFIGDRMRHGCQLFRWTGPAFLMLIDRASRPETVREEFSSLMSQPFEHNVQTARRSIHLPVKCRWTLLPMMAAPRLLMQRIDTFVATPQNAEL